jgi:Ni,Fe-hydrogenase I small subunit
MYRLSAKLGYRITWTKELWPVRPGRHREKLSAAESTMSQINDRARRSEAIVKRVGTNMAITASTLSGRPPNVGEAHILWLTAGLDCDGDTVSAPNAEQPGIEDLILGAIHGSPKV